MAGILMTCVSGFVLKYFHIEGAILISGLCGDVYCGNSRK